MSQDSDQVIEMVELDDDALEDVAGGLEDTNNCDCTVNNCGGSSGGGGGTNHHCGSELY